MAALAAHAFTHRAARRIERGGAVLCIFLPCLSAFAALAFSADGYFRAKWGAWGEGALFDGWPLAVSQALGLTGLAFLPLLLLPEQIGVDYNTKLKERRATKLNSGRSLFAPLVAIFTFVTLPEVFRRYSFLADSNFHVDSRMDLSDHDILGAPCSAVDGTASLSSYVDSPFYAVLLALVFFFPLLDMSASSEKRSKVVKFDSALSQSLCVALALFVVRTAPAPHRTAPAPHCTVALRTPSWSTPHRAPRCPGSRFTTHHAPRTTPPFCAAAGLPSLVRRGAAPRHLGGLLHHRGGKVPHRELEQAQGGGRPVRPQVRCGHRRDPGQCALDC
jgi:hypothetical protein